MISFVPLESVPVDAVEALLDRAFGRDRHGRTAYSIREGVDAIAELSFAARFADGRLAGTIQCWPVALACDGGGSAPMVMVGPVAVDPEWQQEGVGRALMAEMLRRADARDIGALMLIGDPEYYGRFFGFSAERTAGWRLPGPVERHRLLARGAAVPDCVGKLGPDLRKAA
ncbi:N-acetyltransferase [Sphingosinithalassobacter tenebrarum]|uniref:N-acetyltransferase n=1 Tax=Stakelama tenebrarum TaxID=2711215 RepID=A0A6G6Y520_9SPHN|nr:N-acetyltransferase [Sphingosinithalassobacter tenebrarum]QIG79897.1 N-acetyltransferase [Sphingosinithalassobacter tenebrarum]